MKKSNKLKSFVGTVFLMVLLSYSQNLYAQVPMTQSVPDTTKMTYNQISQGLGLFIYPSKGQSQNKQKQDEYECYQWAMEQSGVDPLNLPKVEAQQSSGPTGGAVVGAAKGAAAGAAIGAIAGDTGKGAAIGAAAGAMRGRQQGQKAQAQQNQQAQANASATEQAAKDKFKKAFSVCIEGRGYTVK
ncbi:glycine zipper family protein [Cognataquiflexum aquatile]|uniref:glycine zipper family protein n=1 Tax=Cognataquiflexum aquatile TaxID=2249427 RepID=UPI001E296005|nr:glycine zipper family protein [Cognataquiflexum aquatile]